MEVRYCINLRIVLILRLFYEKKVGTVPLNHHRAIRVTRILQWYNKKTYLAQAYKLYELSVFSGTTSEYNHPIA